MFASLTPLHPSSRFSNVTFSGKLNLVVQFQIAVYPWAQLILLTLFHFLFLFHHPHWLNLLCSSLACQWSLMYYLWSVEDQLHKGSSLTPPKGLEQWLVHTKCSINICWLKICGKCILGPGNKAVRRSQYGNTVDILEGQAGGLCGWRTENSDEGKEPQSPSLILSRVRNPGCCSFYVTTSSPRAHKCYYVISSLSFAISLISKNF